MGMRRTLVQRRTFLTGSAAALAATALPRSAQANVPRPDSWRAMPPTDKRESFIEWMVANRGEDPNYLALRWQRYEVLLVNKDVWNDANKRAYLMTPREEFVLRQNLPRVYDHAFLDIGYGVTISGPHVV